MKATELIEKLQEMVEEHGDNELYFDDGEFVAIPIGSVGLESDGSFNLKYKF